MRRAIIVGTFVLCGVFFYVLLSAVAAGTTGLTVASGVPIILALALAGIAPLVTILRFRAGARTGQVLCALLTLYVLILVADDPSDAFALVAIIPLIATAVIAESGLRRRSSASLESPRWWQLAVGAIPAVTASWLILEILVRLAA